MNYIINFSLKGLLVFILVMLPNIYYFKQLKSVESSPKVNHRLLDILEHTSQMIFIFLLVFVVNKKETQFNSPLLIVMAILLVIYYVLWIFYIRKMNHILLLEGLAIVPVIYFLTAQLWLMNYPAMVPTILFGVIHVIITYQNRNDRGIIC